MSTESLVVSAALPAAGRATHTRVAFVGAGPGDPGLMTLRCRDLIAAADVLVLDQPARCDLVAPLVRTEVLVVDGGHGEHGEQLTHASRARKLVEAAREVPCGSLIVRLMDGDPVLFTGFPEEARALRKAGIPYDVVPGVSAVSYTHLDVYKRQVRVSPSAAASSAMSRPTAYPTPRTPCEPRWERSLRS